MKLSEKFFPMLLQEVTADLGTHIYSKAELRKKMMMLRNGMDSLLEQEANSRICKHILAVADFYADRPVFVYIAKDHEVNLWEAVSILLNRSRSVCAPRICGEDMDFYEITSEEDLKPGPFGLREPAESCRKIVPVRAPVFVPGLAFGKKGERLGYGKGYYDRYFSSHKGNYLYGVGYDFQSNQEFETFEYDLFMQEIITDKSKGVKL